MPRTPVTLAGVLVLALWCGVAAGAVKPAPTITSVVSQDLRAIGRASHGLGAVSCTPGAAGPAVFAVNYLLPPNDSYYTYVRCDACTPDSASISEVHVALRFPVACTQPVEVSFVGASGDTSCLEPDTLALLLAPVALQLTAPAPGDYDFGLVLPKPAHLAGDAFMRLNFAANGGAACTTLATRPQLLTNASCAACRSWNDSVAGREDLCRVLLPGQPVMYGVFETCVVPVRRHSWGELKLIYR